MPSYPQTSSSTQGGATTKRPTTKGRLGRAPACMALDCRLTEKGHAGSSELLSEGAALSAAVDAALLRIMGEALDGDLLINGYSLYGSELACSREAVQPDGGQNEFLLGLACYCARYAEVLEFFGREFDIDMRHNLA